MADISENNVNISSENGVNILKDIKGIEILDISRNSIWVNNNYDTAPYIYPDKEFQYLTQLRSIYIDLHAQINFCHIFVSKRVQQFQSLYKRNLCPGHI
jgi:hypothetical protein